MRAARARAARSPARDRLRVGRHGDVRGAHARLPRHRDHRVARAVRAGERARRRGRPCPIALTIAVSRLPRARPARSTRSSSIEMLEAVGYEFLPRYFATCARVLAPGGRLAVQSITMPDDRFDAYRRRIRLDADVHLPRNASFRRSGRSGPRRRCCSSQTSATSARAMRRRWAAWRERFVAQLPAVRALGFDEPFIRTWLLYLMFSRGGVRGAHARRSPAVVHLPAVTVTVVVMPPRTQNLPITVIDRGEIALDESSQIRLVTASWNAPSSR